jgi:hypothetical protein
VGDEDLEAVDDLSERHALVLLPLLNGFGALDEDNEVLALALVVALGLGGVSAHVGCVGGDWVWVGSVWCWWWIGVRIAMKLECWMIVQKRRRGKRY